MHKTIAASKRYIFQFSLIETEQEEVSLKVAIEKLGGEVDDSPYYSRRATHLIAGRAKSSEKCMCFIASGKWILTTKYITDSKEVGHFLTEDSYHISHVFPKSLIATSSIKWKNKMDESKNNAPFIGWNVACFIENEQSANALIRLIKSGNGRAVYIDSPDNYKNYSDFTMAIHSESLKQIADKFAIEKKIKCFPSLLIADHLLFTVSSSEPVLPIIYYENNPKSRRGSESASNTKPSEESSRPDSSAGTSRKCDDLDECLEAFSSISLDMFLVPLNEYIPSEYREIVLMDSEIECRFTGLWYNGAYSQAINFIERWDNKMLSSDSFAHLLEFLMCEKSEIKTKIKMVNHDDKELLEEAYKYTYLDVYNYVMLHLGYFPPCSQNAEYYKNVFSQILLSTRIHNHTRNYNMTQIVDVLYIMCINDFLMIKTSKKPGRSIQSCALVVEKMYSEAKLCDIIEMMLKQKKNPPNMTSYDKMLQIIAFCHKHYEHTRLYELLERYSYVDDFNNDEDDADVTLESVFAKALSELRRKSKKTLIEDNDE